MEQGIGAYNPDFKRLLNQKKDLVMSIRVNEDEEKMVVELIEKTKRKRGLEITRRAAIINAVKSKIIDLDKDW